MINSFPNCFLSQLFLLCHLCSRRLTWHPCVVFYDIPRVHLVCVGPLTPLSLDRSFQYVSPCRERGCSSDTQRVQGEFLRILVWLRHDLLDCSVGMTVPNRSYRLATSMHGEGGSVGKTRKVCYQLQDRGSGPAVRLIGRPWRPQFDSSPHTYASNLFMITFMLLKPHLYLVDLLPLRLSQLYAVSVTSHLTPRQVVHGMHRPESAVKTSTDVIKKTLRNNDNHNTVPSGPHARMRVSPARIMPNDASRKTRCGVPAVTYACAIPLSTH